MYMGELARLAIERFTKEGLILGGKGSDLLFTRGRFYTKYVSEIESDAPGTYANCKEILEELGELKRVHSVNKVVVFQALQEFANG